MHASSIASSSSRPRTRRCAVSNGKRLLNGIDARTTDGRRYYALIENFSRDLGGVDQLSEAEMSLVRASASLTLKSEQLQAAIIRGEPVDPDELVRLSSEARRCLERIQKREKPKADRLTDYLAKRGKVA